MTGKFKNKYRNETTRTPRWNYAWAGSYFITICTHDRTRFFGHISNGKMILNELGEVVQSEWLKTFEMRPDMNLQMGNYVIMPDHFHAIIQIGKNKFNITREPEPYLKNKFGPQSKNLASLVRGFKIGVTKNARLLNPEFRWQAGFHDSIIRNIIGYYRISNYITKNPEKWLNKD